MSPAACCRGARLHFRRLRPKRIKLGPLCMCVCLYVCACVGMDECAKNARNKEKKMKSRYLEGVSGNKVKSCSCGCCCSVVSDSSRPYGMEHAGLPCPSPSPRVCSDSWPLSQWCHPTISFSIILFSSCLQSFPASGSFLTIRLFTSDGQSSEASASASVLPMNSQGWFPLGLTGLSSLLVKGFWFLLFTR